VTNMASILVVDDETSMREFLAILLKDAGYEVSCADCGKAALDALGRHSFDLVLSDIRMDDMDGLTLLSRIKEINPDLPLVLVTAYASPEDAVLAMKNGAFDYITKPFKVDEVLSVVEGALANVKKEEPAAPALPGIIGKSPKMQKVFDLVQRVAPTQANVIIYGESGTGKELIARAIHQMSKASAHPFVPITCSAIPETLFESEVFGHEKGAFTGAAQAKTGLFELAHNGTAFLDEIGELSPLIQTKLLRVLQERELKRVGSTETIRINVRIISATNKDLEQEVLAGRFREDLFYRLAVVPIRMPPLRERKEDIPLLVEYFLDKYSREFGKEVRSISSYAMQVLMEYDFPGNVRELENIIERGVALANSNIILPESLTISERKPSSGKAGAQAAALLTEQEVLEKGLERALEECEQRILRSALARSGNSKTRAAELLKLSFRQIRYKIGKYGLD